MAMNGVGVDEARFLGFIARLTRRDGSPANSVLNRLINGGGKTSAIKLLTSVYEGGLHFIA
jgi:hypothetical protein